MRLNVRDPAAGAIILRGNGALESFQQEFDFSGVAAASAFTLDLFRAESSYPTAVKLVRIFYASQGMADSWLSGIRQAGALPDGCRDASYTAADANRPNQGRLNANGFIPSAAATETNWEEDFLVKQNGQVSLVFQFKLPPNINQAMNPVGICFIHLARLQ